MGRSGEGGVSDGKEDGLECKGALDHVIYRGKYRTDIIADEGAKGPFQGAWIQIRPAGFSVCRDQNRELEAPAPFQTWRGDVRSPRFDVEVDCRSE